MQQLARQFAHPMLFVRQESLRIFCVAEIVAIEAFHVDWTPTKEALVHKFPHSPRGVSKLEIVTGCYLADFLLRQGNQFFGLSRVEGERLFNINVTACLKTNFRDRKVTLRRRRYMDDIRRCDLQHLREVAEILRDLEALSQLACH